MSAHCLDFSIELASSFKTALHLFVDFSVSIALL